MKKILRIFAVLFVIGALAFGSVATYSAGFGDFSGDNDYGGSDSGGSSFWDDDDDYSFSSGGSSSGGGGGLSLPVVVVIVVIIIVALRGKNKTGGSGGTRSSGPVAPGAQRTTDIMPLDKIYEWDPEFSPDKIKQRLSNLYVQMQDCWTKKDLSSLQGDFTAEQLAQYDRQLDKYRRDGETNYTERIAVLDVTIAGVKQDDKHDILIANLATRITTYTLNDKTGELVSGDKRAEKFMNFEWTLVRPKGSKTVIKQEDSAFNCPNCGAPVNVNASVKCPYCDAVLEKADYDWVIAGIKGISQRTS